MSMREREKCCQLVQHVLDQMLQIIHDDDSFQSWLALYYLFNRFVGIASDGFDHVASMRGGKNSRETGRETSREKETEKEKKRPTMKSFFDVASTFPPSGK